MSKVESLVKDIEEELQRIKEHTKEARLGEYDIKAAVLRIQDYIKQIQLILGP